MNRFRGIWFWQEAFTCLIISIHVFHNNSFCSFPDMSTRYNHLIVRSDWPCSLYFNSPKMSIVFYYTRAVCRGEKANFHSRLCFYKAEARSVFFIHDMYVLKSSIAINTIITWFHKSFKNTNQYFSEIWSFTSMKSKVWYLKQTQFVCIRQFRQAVSSFLSISPRIKLVHANTGTNFHFHNAFCLIPDFIWFYDETKLILHWPDSLSRYVFISSIMSTWHYVINNFFEHKCNKESSFYDAMVYVDYYINTSLLLFFLHKPATYF